VERNAAHGILARKHLDQEVLLPGAGEALVEKVLHVENAGQHLREIGIPVPMGPVRIAPATGRVPGGEHGGGEAVVAEVSDRVELLFQVEM
jgi:hypothetical protein